MSNPFKFLQYEDYEPFSKKEEVEIFTAYSKNKSQDLKNKILEKNIRLVIKIVHQEFSRRVSKNSAFSNSIDESDLISEGCMGLYTAIDKFDVTRGIKFSTYASFWVKQQVLRYISNNCRTIRLPVNFSENMIKVKEFISDYKLKHDKAPTKKRILKEFEGVSETALLHILCNTSMLYLNQQAFDKDGQSDCEFGDLVEDESMNDPSLDAEQNLETQDIRLFLNKLTKKERDIIIKRFGFDGNDPMKLEEIGNEYNVTRERVRQIQTVALHKLGRMIRKSKDTMI